MNSTTLPAKGDLRNSPGRIAMERHAPIDGETQDIYLQTGSAAMGELIQAAHRAAVSPATVLLTGERGVGKNTLARQIHDWSSWRQHPFVVIDCAVLSAKLSQHASFDDILLSLVRSSGVNEPRLVLTGAATIVFDNISKLCHLGQVRLSQFIEQHAPCANLKGDAVGASLRQRLEVRLDLLLRGAVGPADHVGAALSVVGHVGDLRAVEPQRCRVGGRLFAQRLAVLDALEF